MKTRLTERSIKALETKHKAYEVSDSTSPGFMIRIQPSGLRTFWYRYTVSHTAERSKIKLGRYGDITLSQARELATIYAAEVAKGQNPQKERQSKREEAEQKKRLTLGVVIAEHYKPWVLKELKCGENNLYTLDKYFNHLMDRPIDAIGPKDIDTWQISELERGLKPATVNRNLTCLKAVYAKAVSLRLLKESPIKGVKNIKVVDDDRIRFLSNDENGRLLESLRQRHYKIASSRARANRWRSERGYALYPEYGAEDFADHIEPMVLLALNTGLRRGEIFNLSWQDIDFDNAVVSVRASKTKSGKYRHIPMNNTVKRILRRWYQQHSPCSGLVFKNKNGKPFNNIKQAWSRVLEDASISDFRFHDLRHHFASHLVMKGAHLNTVRELLGHSSLEMTLRYAHLAADHKSEAVMLLDD